MSKPEAGADAGPDLLVDRRAHAALLAAAFVGLAAWSWGTWPDLLIDSGRELYVPWRITCGDVLYRDVASVFGPLAPHVHALVFWALGPSLLALALTNLVLLAALTALVYRLLEAVFDATAALLGSLLLLAVFGFGHLAETGNYNFVMPYANGATQGLGLCVGLIAAAGRWLRTGRVRWAALAGACLGAAALTKPELFLGGALAAGLGAGCLALRRPPGRDLARGAAGFLGAALAPPTAAFALFALALPPGQALRAAGGAFAPVLASQAGRGHFYLLVSGLDDPLGNGGRVVVAALAVAGAAAAAAWLDRRDIQPQLRGWWRALLILGLVAVYVQAPRELPRALPLTTLALGALLVARWRREGAERWLLGAMWAGLSLGLLAKVVLNAHFGHYGFVLTLPATLLLAGALVSLLPAALERTPGGGDSTRRVFLYGFGFVAALAVVRSNVSVAEKTLAVGRGSDRFWTAPQIGPDRGAGPLVLRALEQIEARAAPGAAVAVLPEGCMLNYLTRRRAPTPFLTLNPPVFDAYGPAAITAAFRASPPDLVLLVHRDAREYGVGAFGTDPRFGEDLMRWIRARYVEVERLGAEPFAEPDRFGISILAPRPESPGSRR